MVDRIRAILSARQLTPTQFADTIGVARPIVSHILSGRNKPSLEVVQKIVDAFPDVSLTWLLKGAGSMTALEPVPVAAVPAPIPVAVKRPSSSKTPEVPRPAPSDQTAARQPPTLTMVPTAVVSDANRVDTSTESLQREVVPSVPMPPSPDVVATPGTHRPIATALLDAVIPAAPTPLAASSDSATSLPNAQVAAAGARNDNNTGPMVPSAAQPFLKADKAIRRIVIFYQDGTFTDYQPENA
ncbi:helix-turn-helix domain-containing protein [Hymenobacter norwichensis]|uniref:helix-turn-helix domain-containing protein n=1 Tax=Hymenobacter norwichensis TaxID=223903 RepID=UPI0003B6952A|nr:helix-turn-helix transcriptional regulator [Hymenobacter norwichensis]